MKFNMPTLFFTLTLSSTIYCMDTEKKHIMVPLEGFLFRVNTSAALSEMGVGGAFSAAYAGGWSALCRSASSKGPDQTALATRLFALLENVDKTDEKSEQSAFGPMTTQCPDVYWRGIKAPAVIINWLKSTKPCSKIKELVLPHVKENAGRLERTSLETLANIVFDPAKNASMLIPNEEALTLVEALQQKGHTVHVVDNWNSEALEELQKLYPDSFKKMNGKIHISGNSRTVKSANQCGLQDSFFKAHPEVPASSSLFIETEQQHTKPFLIKTFKHVLCASADIKKLQETIELAQLLK